MKVDRIIKWFMPKEEKFHVLLDRDTQNVLRAARLFNDFAHIQNLEDRRVKMVELRAIEHDGDQIAREVFDALNTTFITPFDREDIRSIASYLDDIVDHVEGVAQNLILFDLPDSPEALKQFAAIITAMAEQIHKATGLIWNLANEKEIRGATVRISELENQADTLFNTVIADLFKAESRNPVEILKWKTIYEGLEEACDACKDYTHILSNVVIKNA